MKRLTADLWDAPEHTAIVIPTNVGWRKDGTNVMGQGVALQAAALYRELPGCYGAWCQSCGDRLFLDCREGRWLICFPVKPQAINPALSWRNRADLGLIERSTRALATFAGEVWLPLVGCGNGGLDPALVIPVLDAYLDDRYTLVTLPSAVFQ